MAVVGAVVVVTTVVRRRVPWVMLLRLGGLVEVGSLVDADRAAAEPDFETGIGGT